MYRTLCKSKIHRATITDANLHYEGSITIDSDLLEAADIVPYEKVHVVNVNNGSRLETYAIEGRRGSGDVCLNGAAARLGARGDAVIVISYATVDDAEAREWQPKKVMVDKRNRIMATSLDRKDPTNNHESCNNILTTSDILGL
ncbi:MAG: aspartate 1-decarboxylase [Candidatus Abyssobacteria bacterium SURF_17]|uniref:Aspartate 1-decarboxylase n=1 Tax=Candidatus Abyssobacteria bacterium SURF_17 TaxID=2093361 RepID=A0A419F7H6_9BACT|nr:MAG: aspartate 1-decarboxylase [Candidatus Abyssubacteria bacterium SURF_17]